MPSPHRPQQLPEHSPSHLASPHGPRSPNLTTQAGSPAPQGHSRHPGLRPPEQRGRRRSHRGSASALVRTHIQPLPGSWPHAQRIWVTHHLDAPVPGAGGLSQAEEGNRCQVRVRDLWIASIQGLLGAWRGGRGALGPRLLRDSWLSCWGCGRGRGRRRALSHGSASREPCGRNRQHVAGRAWHPLPRLASPDKGTRLRQPSLGPPQAPRPPSGLHPAVRIRKERRAQMHPSSNPRPGWWSCWSTLLSFSWRR